MSSRRRKIAKPSDAAIHARHQSLHPRAQERFNREADGLCISSVVLMELLHGAGKSVRVENDRQAVEDFAARLDVLAFDARAAAHAAEIRAELERCGQRIGPHDLQIAGHARSQGLTLVTGNLMNSGVSMAYDLEIG